jgi:hypothetical protein
MAEATLPCKEPGCRHSVVYSRDDATSTGAALKVPKWLSAERTIAVYLPCPAGHVHRYDITLGRTDDNGRERTG